VNLESWASGEARPRRALRLDAKVQDGKMTAWKVEGLEEPSPSSPAKSEESAKTAFLRNFEFRLPLSWLLARPLSATSAPVTADSKTVAAIAPTSRLRLRFSLWHNNLPVDALPVEGWIELQLLSEADLGAGM
jgi:hypothetical protein